MEGSNLRRCYTNAVMHPETLCGLEAHRTDAQSSSTSVCSFYTMRRVASEPQTDRRISIAKRVLSEATLGYSPVLTIQEAKATKNTGALEPLLSMLRSSSNVACLRTALDTLSFLTVDQSNTKIALDLGAPRVLLDLVQNSTSVTLSVSILETLVALARFDDTVKIQCWESGSKQTILDLLHSKLDLNARLRLFTSVKHLAFISTENTPVLLVPQLVSIVGNVLHPSLDLGLLHQCFEVLKAATRSPGFAKLPGWHECIFKLVPFLTPGTPHYGTKACLNLLCTLGDVDSFRNVLYAAGCLPPVLSLLSSTTTRIASCASSLLAILAEGGLSRDKLCEAPVLVVLLRVLRSKTCTDVQIGILYTLTCLTTYNKYVAQSLREGSAVPALTKVVQSTGDECAALGAQNLIDILLADNAKVCEARRLVKSATEVGIHRLCLDCSLTAAPAMSGSITAETTAF